MRQNLGEIVVVVVVGNESNFTLVKRKGPEQGEFFKLETKS